MKINSISQYKPVMSLKKQNHKADNSMQNTFNENLSNNSNTVNFSGIGLYMPRVIRIDPKFIALNCISTGLCGKQSDFPIPNELLDRTTELLEKYLVSKNPTDDTAQMCSYGVILSLNTRCKGENISNSAMNGTLIDFLQPVMDRPAEQVIDGYFGINTYKHLMENENTDKNLVSDYFSIENDTLIDNLSNNEYYSDILVDYGNYLSSLCDYQLAGEYKNQKYPKIELPQYDKSKYVYSDGTVKKADSSSEKMINPHDIFIQETILNALISSKTEDTLVNEFVNNFSKQLDKFEDEEKLAEIKLPQRFRYHYYKYKH